VVGICAAAFAATFCAAVGAVCACVCAFAILAIYPFGFCGLGIIACTATPHYKGIGWHAKL
jgi:hypothetical protein